MTRFAGIILFLLVFGLPCGALAAEGGSLTGIDRALGSSAYSGAERAALHAKSAEAIKAGLSAEDVEIVVSRSLGRGADAATVKRFLDAGISAKKEGAPAGPVLDRIELGLSKGVPTDRIAAAAEQLSTKLVVARPLVDGLIRDGVKPGRSTDRDEAIEGTARALEKSIPEESLKEMGAAVKGKGKALPLYTGAANTAAYFVGNGMSPMKASRLVRDAVAGGYSGRDLDAMVRRMYDEMKRGARMDDIAERMEREGMMKEREMDRESMHENMRNGPGMGGASGMGGMGGRGR